MSGGGYFDGREMLMLHRAFRREFALAPALVRRVDDGDTLRCRTVAAHLQFLATTLQEHHTFEDKAVWPTLVERVSDETASHLRQVEGQHSRLDVAVAAMNAAMACWGLGAAARSRDHLAAALDRLLSSLVEHMDFEERCVVPLMERHIRHDEWNQMIAEVATDLAPDRVPLLFGMNMYEGDPDIVEQVIACMPREMQAVIRETAEQAYGRHAQLIHGTPTPPRSTEVYA